MEKKLDELVIATKVRLFLNHASIEVIESCLIKPIIFQFRQFKYNININAPILLILGLLTCSMIKSSIVNVAILNRIRLPLLLILRGNTKLKRKYFYPIKITTLPVLKIMGLAFNLISTNVILAYFKNCTAKKYMQVSELGFTL